MAWDEIWEKVFQNQQWGKYPAEDLIRFVARNFYRAPDRGRTRILELGCGPGGNLWYLAREGFTVVGIDGSPTAVEQAKTRLDEEVPDWKGEVTCGDITRLPFEDNSCDGAIDSEAIYCNSYADSQTIYREIRRVLKPGGKLFSRTFATGSWGDGTGKEIGSNFWFVAEGPAKDKGPCRFTSGADIEDLLSVGLVVENIELLTRSQGVEGSHPVKEWLITAVKT